MHQGPPPRPLSTRQDDDKIDKGRSPKIARRSRPSPGLLAAGSVVAVGAYPRSDPEPNARASSKRSWLVESPVPIWLPTTLAALLVLQWSAMAVIAMNG